MKKISFILGFVMLFCIPVYSQATNTSSEELSILLHDSDAVAMVKVLSVEADITPDTEKTDKIYYMARVLVVEKLKRNLSKEIYVMFEADAKNPKPMLHKDQKAILILYRAQSLSDYYFIFSDLQVQPLKNLNKIRRLISPNKLNHAIQKESKNEERLKSLVVSSDLVITGQVVEVQLLNSSTLLDERDPKWEVAIVEISKVLKCKLPKCDKQLAEAQNRVSIVYPGSHSPQWRSDPKLRLGQKGIFILFTNSKKLDDRYFSLYTDRQIQKLENVAQIQKLLRSPK